MHNGGTFLYMYIKIPPFFQKLNVNFYSAYQSRNYNTILVFTYCFPRSFFHLNKFEPILLLSQNKQIWVVNDTFLSVGPKLKDEILRANFDNQSTSLSYNFYLYGSPKPTVSCGLFPHMRENTWDGALFMYTVTIASPKAETIPCIADNGIGRAVSFNIQVQLNSEFVLISFYFCWFFQTSEIKMIAASCLFQINQVSQNIWKSKTLPWTLPLSCGHQTTTEGQIRLSFWVWSILMNGWDMLTQ